MFFWVLRDEEFGRGGSGGVDDGFGAGEGGVDDGLAEGGGNGSNGDSGFGPRIGGGGTGSREPSPGTRRRGYFPVHNPGNTPATRPGEKVIFTLKI